MGTVLWTSEGRFTCGTPPEVHPGTRCGKCRPVDDTASVQTLLLEQPWRARAIWRFELPITDEHVIEMPAHSKVVAVAASRHDPQGLELWAAVDPERELVARTFLVVGTGHPIPEAVTSYHGMAQTHGGALVWHVLESAR